MGGRTLFLVVSAIASVAAIQRQGLLQGLFSAFLFGGFVWLVVWPLWLLTETEPITKYVASLPAWLVAMAWPIACVWLWLLEPDHSPLGHSLPLFVKVPGFWLVALAMPLLTLRWFKLRRSPRL